MKSLEGPAWSAPGLDIAAGRYPLAVERHVMRMADLLVPGVTTVTPHGRYFALHALIAVEAERRGLSNVETQRLLRRAEVALAAVSWSHEDGDTGLPRAHGTDALARRLHSGTVDVVEASQPGQNGYVRNSWGFWPPYSASEISLGVLAPGATPLPGPNCDAAAVRDGLGDLLDLAERTELVVDDLGSYGALCVCTGGDAADGRWLAGLVCGDSEADPRSPQGTRRETIRLVSRVMETHPVDNVTDDVGPVIAFGAFATHDEVVSRLAATAVWRGVILRNYSVGAWRRLWSWLVEQVKGLTRYQDVEERFAERLPAMSVQDFLSQLPATQSPSGDPSPAEEQLRASDLPLPYRELSVLAVNARRVHELDGHVRDAFFGDRHGIDLAPEWTERRFAASASMSLQDFARQLTAELLTRARRVALAKAVRRSDGTLWLPTRLHERGDWLYKTSDEGRGDVGLRLDQLTSVLAGAGVLHRVDGTWRVTPAGEALLA